MENEEGTISNVLAKYFRKLALNSLEVKIFLKG